MKGKLILSAITATAFVMPTLAQDAAKTAAKPAAKTTKVRGTAYVRVLHAIAGGPRVDVYVDGKKTLDDVAFKTISDYMAVPSGQRTFSINAATKAEVLLTEKKNLVADKY